MKYFTVIQILDNIRAYTYTLLMKLCRHNTDKYVLFSGAGCFECEVFPKALR